MALINQNNLFDQLKIYIDQKITGLNNSLNELFDEYEMDIIAENIDAFLA